MSYLNQLRASMPSFSSLSSGSTGYEPVSDSETTDYTPLCTPMPNTFDSVFNNQFFEDFSGLVPWQGLTDGQWERHLLTTSKSDCFPETNTLGVDNECLYDQTDQEFDAVAAVRAGLMRSRPTYTTQRALEIIDRRSKSELTWNGDDTTEHLMARQTVVVHQEEIEDYTADFEISDQLEVLTSAGDSSVELSFKRDSVLDTIEEEDENEDGELIPSIRLVAPTTPMIDLAVETWEYPSFSTPSTVLSTPDSVSHLLMSPFFSSPAVFQDSIVHLGQDSEFLQPPIPSVQFGSRHPQPTSLLDEDFDVPKLADLKVEPSTPYSGMRLDGNLHTSWSHGFALPSQDDYSPDEDSGDGCGPYIPKVPPKDPTCIGLGIYLGCATIATVTAGSNHPVASPAYTTSGLEDSERRMPKVKGLSLRLPSGLKLPLKRHTASLRTSESCQDFPSSGTTPLLMAEHGLSTPMSSRLSLPTANSSPASFRTFSPRCVMRNRNPGQSPTFRVNYMARRINSVKRTLSFLF